MVSNLALAQIYRIHLRQIPPVSHKVSCTNCRLIFLFDTHSREARVQEARIRRHRAPSHHWRGIFRRRRSGRTIFFPFRYTARAGTDPDAFG